MKKRTMNVNIPVTDEQIERLEKLLPKVRDASMQEPGAEDRLEEVLKERLRNAARIKQDVEVWINTIPVRMQRIIRYRIFEGMTWEQVAIRMGRGATGDSVRVEYVRFMNVG